MTKHILTAIFFLFTVGLLQAQEYTLTKSSDLSISGTSSLHDWTMDAEQVKGSGTIIVEGSQLKDVKNLKIIVDAESLKSGKSGMDKNAYKALNTDKHKQITFTLTDVKSITGNKVVANGKLTISGVTKNITVNADYKLDNGNIVFTGAVPFKMTTFNIEPPTAMFGTIKTGDKITVNYKAVFNN